MLRLSLTILVMIEVSQVHAQHLPEISKPNVVFILADDLGYSDLGCYGSEIQTPNLDQLARNGLKFSQFYNTGRCWPSRAALLTGYYAQQVNRDPAANRPAWAALLPELLKPAGYRSYHSGKWHVDGKILEGGFSRSYHTTDHDRYFSPQHHQLDDRPLAPPKADQHYYATTATADYAIQWLKQHQAEYANQPFFLYLAFIAPHFPLQAPSDDIARYRDRYRDGWNVIRSQRWQRMKEMRLVAGPISEPEPDVVPSWNPSEKELQQRIGPGEVGHAVSWDSLTVEQRDFQAQKMAVHAAMIDRMDREIGRVLEQLKQSRQFDNSLIFFASDNGASAEQIIRGDGHTPGAALGSAASYLGLGPGWSTVSNTPFRRHKSWNHEGGIATPLIVHWPSGIPAKGELRHGPGHLVDIAPTLMELAGLKPPADWNNESRPAWSGRSLVPLFARDAGAPHDAIYFKHMDNRALRNASMKIVAAGKGSSWELYDLGSDRSETRNLAGSRAQILNDLVSTWNALDDEFKKQGATAGPNPAQKKP